MSLLNDVAGAVMGKMMGGGNQGGMAAIAMELLNSNGGIGGLLGKLQASGLGDAAASWVGKGANMPVSADQITSALGGGQLAEIAAKFGISPDVLSSQLAEHLPGVIDKATPNGEVTAESGNLLGSILGMLK